MNCVVCSKPLSERHYANAWESARKQYPCCSVDCATRFDPDAHWLPAAAPAAASYEDEQRLLAVSRRRVASGDLPSIVVREMLLAGVPVTALRKIVTSAHLKLDSTEKAVTRLNMLGFLSGLIAGRFRLYERRSDVDPKQLRRAIDDLETWQQRFGK